jgi:serine/threonine protein kinase
MSPEQARGLRDIDHRADLWSLAVILYTMLTGKNPFESDVEAVGDIVIRVAVGEIPPPTSLNPSLPRGLDAFFERALSRERDERFQSSDELAKSFMLSGDISYPTLDLETSTGDGWPRVVLERVSRAEAPTVTTATSPAVSDEGLDSSGARARKMRLTIAVLLVAGVGVMLLLRSLWQNESAEASGKLTDTAVPTIADEPPPVVSAPQPTEPTVSVTRTTEPVPTRKTVVPKSPSPVPSPPQPDDEDQPPQWFENKNKQDPKAPKDKP